MPMVAICDGCKRQDRHPIRAVHSGELWWKHQFDWFKVEYSTSVGPELACSVACLDALARRHHEASARAARSRGQRPPRPA